MDRHPEELNLVELNLTQEKKEKLNHLNYILYPEGLENSKIVQLLSENNFQFKITDLLNLKEITKITTSKEELTELIEMISFIKLAENKENASFVINPKIVVFSFLNLPQKMTKEEVIGLLNLNQNNLKFERLYKKSLYWILVINKNTEEFEKKLREVKINDGKLTFDSFNHNQLIRSIGKQIQTYNYHKEANDLKVEKKNNNSNNITGNKDRTNSEAFSWRKQSIEQNAAFNSPKMSIE